MSTENLFPYPTNPDEIYISWTREGADEWRCNCGVCAYWYPIDTCETTLQVEFRKHIAMPEWCELLPAGAELKKGDLMLACNGKWIVTALAGYNGFERYIYCRPRKVEEKKSETPRTDANLNRNSRSEPSYVFPDFARQLERELSEALKAKTAAETERETMRINCTEHAKTEYHLRAQINTLTIDKKEAEAGFEKAKMQSLELVKAKTRVDEVNGQLFKELKEAEETLAIQHSLMVDAEKRGVGKGTEQSKPTFYKTSERKPTREDANEHGFILAWDNVEHYWFGIHISSDFSLVKYWKRQDPSPEPEPKLDEETEYNKGFRIGYTQGHYDGQAVGYKAKSEDGK